MPEVLAKISKILKENLISKDYEVFLEYKDNRKFRPLWMKMVKKWSSMKHHSLIIQREILGLTLRLWSRIRSFNIERKTFRSINRRQLWIWLIINKMLIINRKMKVKNKKTFFRFIYKRKIKYLGHKISCETWLS